ncbi:hypothetical protein K7X08_012618 [Anisodus acutangulus]|uniref:Uncharacterized protein n=1 Tax=Anisodus acutangulus TaxID=402998 RepID=A0A9Q1M9K2_9SOLA|nr:hypothetical protein K7X08_012618 [Anisodus acutangulus]
MSVNHTTFPQVLNMVNSYISSLKPDTNIYNTCHKEDLNKHANHVTCDPIFTSDRESYPVTSSPVHNIVSSPNMSPPVPTNISSPAPTSTTSLVAPVVDPQTTTITLPCTSESSPNVTPTF